MARAALFDLDRTLVRKETATLYVRYQRERGEATLGDLARTLYWVAQYTVGVIDAERVARRAFATLAGTSEAVMIERCDAWFLSHVSPQVAEEGKRAVERHRDRGDHLVIATGATLYTARPLARTLGIEHILATELEVERGLFTGRTLPPLGYGKGKALRAEKLARELGFRLDEATFYTDSLTDLPLLEKVGEPVCVNPDVRLKRLARRRGWRIERW